MKRKIGCVIALCMMAILLALPCSAHEKEEHYKELKKVLFPVDYVIPQKSVTIQNKIKGIEAASYLALDQFNGNGEAELKQLHNLGVPLIPESIDDIDFTYNSQHRKFTHKGWEHQYELDKASWSKRKTILLESINTIFAFEHSNVLRGYDKQCNSFAALVYYVHVIGDHIEDETFTQTELKMDLGGRKDEQDIITELQNHFAILFESQKWSLDYLALAANLKLLNYKISKLVSSQGGINTQEKFEKYHSYAEDLMEALQKYVPGLLKDEVFFAKVFYPESFS